MKKLEMSEMDKIHGGSMTPCETAILQINVGIATGSWSMIDIGFKYLAYYNCNYFQ